MTKIVFFLVLMLMYYIVHKFREVDRFDDFISSMELLCIMLDYIYTLNTFLFTKF